MCIRDRVDIIERHHDKKAEAPSGTAIKTAEMIALAQKKQAEKAECTELMRGARGATLDNIGIHSIRLSGSLAHQEVLFGGSGETLTIKHDSMDRTCFMPGILLACEKVCAVNQLYYGLEHFL